MVSRRSLFARRQVLRWILVLAGVAGCRSEVEVTLLTISDFHGAVGKGGRDPATGRPWGGGMALAAKVRAARLEKPGATFLLDAGDAWQGTPESNFSFGRSTVGYLDRLGVDAAALGNHEFDWGVDTLRARIGAMRFPLLAANVFEQDGKPPAWARGTAILERGGVKIGVIGFATPETPRVTLPQNVAHLRFRPPEDRVDSLVTLVRSQGADLVVLLCHIGAEADSTGALVGPLASLAARVKGVDAIVGGHTHTCAAGFVGGIPVVVSGTKGRALGQIDLRWNGKRVLSSAVRWRPVYADSLPGPADAAIASFVDSVQRVTAPRVQAVVAHTDVRLGTETLAHFVAVAMQERVHADVALTNIGGIRTELEVGAITEADVFELIPFENTLVTGRMRGAALLAFIACNPVKARLAGLRSGAATGAGAGKAGEWLDPSGKPLDPDREYLVVTNNFLAQGGDGFKGFLEARDLTWTEYRVRDAVRDAFAAGQKP